MVSAFHTSTQLHPGAATFGFGGDRWRLLEHQKMGYLEHQQREVGDGKEMSLEEYCRLSLLPPVLHPGPARHNKTARVRG